MKPVRFLIAAIATTFVLTACGGKDLCDRTAKDAEDCGETFSDADLEACKTSIDDCDNQDHKILNGYYDCINDGDSVCLGETATTADLDDLADLLTCFEELEDLSTECATGLSGGTTSWTTSTSWTGTSPPTSTTN